MKRRAHLSTLEHLGRLVLQLPRRQQVHHPVSLSLQRSEHTLKHNKGHSHEKQPLNDTNKNWLGVKDKWEI